ncbi:hypothetical protein LguiB_026516 [Lonicera macranthoides]
MTDHFFIHLNHGGKFVSEPLLHYNGGKVDYFYNVDLDKMSYFEIKGMVEDLGYKNIAKLYYFIHRKSMEIGLRLIDNDKDINKMMVHVQAIGGIEIYIEFDKGKSKIDNIAPSAPTTPTALIDEMMDDVRDEVGEESENESDGSLDIDTNNEELVDIRKKIHSLRLKMRQVSAPSAPNIPTTPVDTSPSSPTTPTAPVNTTPSAHTVPVNTAHIDAPPVDTNNVYDDFVTDNVRNMEYDSVDVDFDQYISPLSSKDENGSVIRNKERYPAIATENVPLNTLDLNFLESHLEHVYNHLLGLVHHKWVLSLPKLGLDGDLSTFEERKDWELISCATKLIKSEIKFERSVGIMFDVRLVNKTLVIPSLSINDMIKSRVPLLTKLKQGPDGDLSALEEKGDWQFKNCAIRLAESGIKFKKFIKKPEYHMAIIISSVDAGDNQSLEDMMCFDAIYCGEHKADTLGDYGATSCRMSRE